MSLIRVGRAYAGLLDHERHERGSLAIRTLGRRRFLALFPLAERLDRPTTVRLLFAPSLGEDCRTIGIGNRSRSLSDAHNRNSRQRLHLGWPRVKWAIQ